MSLQHITLIDQIELLSTGDVNVRLKLLVTEGDDVISTRYHRTSFPADADPVAHMALVNTHLAMLPAAPVSLEDTNRLVALCTLDRSQPGRKDDANRLFKKPQAKV